MILLNNELLEAIEGVELEEGDDSDFGALSYRA
jgi:hypothetical protein